MLEMFILQHFRVNTTASKLYYITIKEMIDQIEEVFDEYEKCNSYIVYNVDSNIVGEKEKNEIKY